MTTVTHKGWLLFCLVYIGAPESEAPLVVARHYALEPVLWLACLLLAAGTMLVAIFGRLQPMMPLLITGRLAEPIPARED